jgi:hypothetical protein
MFFRREKAKVLSFEDHVRNVESAGFAVTREGNGARAVRGFCAAQFQMGAEKKPEITRAGIVIGNEIAVLVSRGYQMTLETPSGKKAAAQAPQLKALHAFQEDLREALGLTSLYNLSLGTVSVRHDYDRVEDREAGPAAKPWERDRARA